MNGHVFACSFGANIPCEIKGNTERNPNPAIVTYCEQNPKANSIPAYVTGRETVYEWQRIGGKAKITPQFTKVGERGIIESIWYPLDPPPVENEPDRLFG